VPKSRPGTSPSGPSEFAPRPDAYATRPGEYGTQPAGYRPQPGPYRSRPGGYPSLPVGPGREPAADDPTEQFGVADQFGAADRDDLLAESALDQPGEQDKKARGGGRQTRFWRELAVIVIAATVLTLIIKAFVVQVYRIPSASMENTLMVGDRVLVNKLVYHFRGIDRGDIIVFSGQGSWGPDAPPPSSNPVVRVFDDVLSAVGLHDEQTYYIKRVIGLPGDRVACCDAQGRITVNGVPLNESSYLNPYKKIPASWAQFHVTVPAGHVWVMGDNRYDSDDSLDHDLHGFPNQGTIPVNEVVGRAFMVIWPPSQFTDLPIPSTFQQAALHSGAAGATVLQVGGSALDLGGKALDVVAAAPVAGTASAAGVVGAPLLLLRQRRKRSR
jgi:signal peptidase I